MFKKNKAILAILSVLLLTFLGIELVSNNVIQMMAIEETKQQVEEIKASATNLSSSGVPGTVVGGNMGGASVAAQYEYLPGHYCLAHGVAIAVKADGDPVPDKGGTGRKQETTYEYDGSVVLAQSIAYAKWVGVGDPEIQDLIWASNQWLKYTGESCLRPGSATTGPYKTTDPGIFGRSTMFANFVYKALNSETGNLGLHCSITEDNDDRLKLMVNQNDDTYTLGPYVLSFPAQDDELDSPSVGTLEELVWDEIVHEYANKFIWGNIDATITFQDGTAEPNTYVDILDENGEVVEEHFPHFGKEFYIRYHSNKDAKIVDFIKPRIEVTYLKKFENVYMNKYKPVHVDYSMLHDEANLIDDAVTGAFGGGAATTGSTEIR